MSSRRDSLRLAALVAFLTVVGVVGSSWTDEAAAQDRAVLARPHVTAVASPIPGGTDVLIAIGTLQLIGVMVFEGMAFVRRRSDRHVARPHVRLVQNCVAASQDRTDTRTDLCAA